MAERRAMSERTAGKGVDRKPQSAMAREPRREVESAELFEGARELLIRHAGETYILRHTNKGKLILTK